MNVWDGYCCLSLCFVIPHLTCIASFITSGRCCPILFQMPLRHSTHSNTPLKCPQSCFTTGHASHGAIPTSCGCRPCELGGAKNGLIRGSDLRLDTVHPKRHAHRLGTGKIFWATPYFALHHSRNRFRRPHGLVHHFLRSKVYAGVFSALKPSYATCLTSKISFILENLDLIPRKERSTS